MPTITAAHLATVSALSDLDAAAALSVPILSPKRDAVTLKTIGGAWNLGRAAGFRRWLEAEAAQQSELGAVASTVLALIDGPGFDASHPDVAGAVGLLVEAKGCTDVEASAVLYDKSYLCGGIVTADYVREARAEADAREAAIARAVEFGARRRLASDRYNAAVSAIDAAEMSRGEVPSDAEVLALMGRIE